MDYYSALDLIPSATESNDWRKMVTGTLGDEILGLERSTIGVGARSTMSGLFPRNQSKFAKRAEFENVAVILVWKDDRPTHAQIIDGCEPEEWITIPIAREKGCRFKGTFSLDA